MSHTKTVLYYGIGAFAVLLIVRLVTELTSIEPHLIANNVIIVTALIMIFGMKHYRDRQMGKIAF